MIKKLVKYMTAFVLILALSSSLVGCHKQKPAKLPKSAADHFQKNSKSADSSKKAQQQTSDSSKASKSKAPRKASPQPADQSSKASIQASVAAAPVQGQKQAASQAVTQAPSNSQSSIAISALLKGDYSSIAGKWQNDLGQGLLIHPNGQVSTYQVGDGNDKELGQQMIVPHNTTNDQNVYQGGISSVGAESIGAAFFVTPAGQTVPNTNTILERDTIFVGQSTEALQHLYVRVQ
ncbi:DUF6287 domain-containing protein [Streptococcus halichoeri]|uniref:DUF6287 domain-containing protein n=1 Tax=Streptococcus halichoeri TaxID=254785 RepID=UPI001357E471|nr:DUF6287 domain-containing protein [Streptococcus halichoeri]